MTMRAAIICIGLAAAIAGGSLVLARETGDHTEVTTEMLIERALAGEDEEPGPAARDLRLRAGPRSILRYRARVEAGTVAFADTSRRQPAAFFEVAKLARDVARRTCGLPR